MKGKIIFSGGLLVVLIVLAVLVMQKPGGGDQKSETGCQRSGIGVQEEGILKTALESPEKFQALETEEVSAAPKIPAVPTERPMLLSEMERPEGQASGIKGQEAERKPVATSDLYFWKDYESLRKDEIRNPDSKENREGVVALLKARQRRVTE